MAPARGPCRTVYGVLAGIADDRPPAVRAASGSHPERGQQSLRHRGQGLSGRVRCDAVHAAPALRRVERRQGGVGGGRGTVGGPLAWARHPPGRLAGSRLAGGGLAAMAAIGWDIGVVLGLVLVMFYSNSG